MKIKAIIFDFDGLIVDTENLWYEAFSTLLKKHYNYTLTLETFNLGVGSSGNQLYKHIEKEINQPINITNLRTQANEYFWDKCLTLKLMDGIPELLTFLEERNIRKVIATSSPLERPTRILDNLGVLEHFEFIISKEDVKESKPSPELFLKAHKNLNLPKENIIILEDSVNGVLAANSANITVYTIPNNITKHSTFPSNTTHLNSALDVIDLINL